MKRTISRSALFMTLAATATLLTACGGGGGSTGGSIPSTPIVVVSPTPTPTPTYTLSGAVTSCDSTFTGNGSIPGAGSICTPGTPISGVQVIVGSVPCANTSTGFAACSTPAAPTQSSTTDANGNYLISGLKAGTYMVQISNGSGYATLHARVIISSNLLVGYRLTALSSTEQAWLTQFNTDRHNANASASGSLVIDEYSEEMSRAFADYLASASCNATCLSSSSSPTPYANQYTTNGGIYTDYVAWNYPNPNWQTAESSMMGDTGGSAYPAVTATDAVWAGLAEGYSGGNGPVFVWSLPK